MKSLLGALAFMGGVGALTLAFGPARPARVNFRLVDGGTDRTTPAMVCITSADDGMVRLPPDGRINPKPSTTAEFTGGVSYRAEKDWIGPVRKTTGKGDNRDRSYVYGLLPSLPYWSQPVMYQTSGEFSIRLPAGRWNIAVSHGMEYVPVTVSFATRDGETIDRTIRLERWIDLPAEGWYSGDVHVHHPTVKESHRAYLLEYAKAEDVHLVNALEQHHTGGSHSPQAGFGKKFRVRSGETWLVSGQEAPSSTFGHIMGLNVDRLVHDPKTVDFYDVSFRAIHESPGALVGYAHFSWNGCNLPRGFPWYVTTEELDFVELMQFAKVNAPGYYDYLNLGFRLSAAAGSDVPWGSTMGEVRTYVHTGKDFDPDLWFAGLKEGRTFVSNGPALDFTVDGQRAGTVIRKAKGGTLIARARLRSHPRIGLPAALRIVSNDGVVTETREGAVLTLETKIPLDRSRWIVAAGECANGALAHSSPVYVVVDGRPTWSVERGPGLVDKQVAAIRGIEKEFAGRTDARSRGILERLAKATDYYGKLKRAMEKARAGR